MEHIRRIWQDNRAVYGVRKVWHSLQREGRQVARCTVERLMRQMGLKGVIRGRKVIKTRPDTARPSPDDRVNRQFRAEAPNQLWVSDFTYGAPRPGWSGGAYDWNAKEKGGTEVLPCSLLWGNMSPSGGDLLSTGRVT